MSRELGLTKGGKRPWRRRLAGEDYDPKFSGRMPASLLNLVRARAAARQTSTSDIIREALVRYVEGEHAS